MAPPFFRDEVRRERERAALGRIVLVRPLSHAALTAAALAVAAAVLTFLVLAQVARKETLAGTLVPASGAIRIVAPQTGVVRARGVREGERVVAGQPLLRLVDARATAEDGAVGRATLELAEQRLRETRRQREETRAAAASERRALAERIEGLAAEMTLADREIDTLAAREALARRSLERFAELEQLGFVSTAQRQQREDEALAQRSRTQAARRARLALAREKAGFVAALAEARERARAQDAALQAQLALLAQEQVERRALAEAVVAAPATGLVAAWFVGGGQLVGAGASLATLLPEGSPLEAHLSAPSRAVGFIREGQEVLLRYPAFPYQKFGAHRGRVLAVSRSAAPAAELGFLPPDGAREAVYRVKVALASQSVPVSGRPEPLQAGMLVQADILLERRRAIEWMFEPLIGLAGRS